MLNKFARPLGGLADLWEPKLLLATVAAGAAEAVRALLSISRDLVVVKPTLAVGLFLLLVLDLATGYRAARRRGEARTSTALRQSADKLTSYIAVVLGVAIFTNMFLPEGGPWEFATSGLLNATFLFLAFTEVKSIAGNTTGSEELGGRWLEAIWELAGRAWPGDKNPGRGAP